MKAPGGGESLELEVVDLAADGRGIGRDDRGKTVFVPDSLPGERIRCRRKRRRRRFDLGVLETVLRPAATRVAPRCAHFGVCGGCALQHLDANAQIQFKQQSVFAALERLAGLVPERRLDPITGSPWGYRRRARLAVEHVAPKNATLVGFRERGSAVVAQLDACHTLHPEVGKRLPELQKLIQGLSIRGAVPQIEVAAGDNGTALVLRLLQPPSADDLARLRGYAQASGLWLYLQSGGLDTVTPLLEPTPTLSYALPEFQVEIHFAPTDFVQVHAEVNAAMVARAVELLDPGPADQVLDVFAGIGNFSLPLARKAARVRAVEGDAGMVARAAANARANGLANVDSYHADLFSSQDNPAWLRDPVDLLLLDPPRSGAREILPAVAARAPRRILYCSCHPATLARDAATLVNEHGYRLTAAGAVDMFPHTAHIEAMALFSK